MKADLELRRHHAFQFSAQVCRVSADLELAGRYIEGQPNFRGTGATLSFWYRHRKCDDPADSCGLFLLSAFEEGPKDEVRCWTLWLEKSKVRSRAIAKGKGSSGASMLFSCLWMFSCLFTFKTKSSILEADGVR